MIEYFPSERTAMIIDIIREQEQPISTPDLAKALSQHEGGTKVTAPIIRMYCKRIMDKTGSSIIDSVKLERIPHRGGCLRSGYFYAQTNEEFR